MNLELAFTVPDAATLDRVASQPHPRGMKARIAGHRLIRETYFDTVDGALRDQSMVLCLRQSADRAPEMELRRMEGVDAAGCVRTSVIKETLPAGGLYAALRGDSELASSVRSLAAPPALRPVLARDLDREEWDVRARWLRRGRCRLCLDRIVAHHRGRSQPQWEVVATSTSPEIPMWQAVLTHLRTAHGLTPDDLSVVDRAAVAFQGAASPGPAARGRHRVVAVVLAGERVALVEGASGMTLPAVRGSGETAALAAAAGVERVVPVRHEAELLGTAPPAPDGDEVEAWLVEGGEDAEEGSTAFWIPLQQLLERVGSPDLRDPALVTALLLLVTSDVGARRVEALSGPTDAPLDLPRQAPRSPVEPGEDPRDFLELELGILDFNTRVLEMAEDASVPLLERFRFLAIVSANLDELFIVRAGRLKREERDLPPGDDSPPTAPHLRDLLAVRVRALIARQRSCLRRMLLPELERKGTRIRTWADLGEADRAVLNSHFERRLLPVLTPRALTGSPGQPFPHLESLRLSLAVVLDGAGAEDVPLRLAQVTIPPDLDRFLPVQGTRDIIAVEEVVAANVSALFPGVHVTAVHAFRVTRTGEVDIDEGAAESLLMAIEDEVEARPFKPPVRLEVERGTPREVLAYLLRNLRQGSGGGAASLDHSDVFEVDGPLDLRGLAHVTSLDVPDGVYPAFHPPAPWPEGPVFDLLRARDRLVYHPYEPFDASVTRFLTEAAVDPHVLSIKITLYRTGADSPFAAALLEALRNGKDVAVFVELKARFDETSNIGWTRRILEAGGHVVYGVVGFKTHAKVALVVRREGEEVRRYVHIGTGNFNATTSRFYTDLSLLSADADLGADLSDFFNELTGSAGPPVKDYRRLLVAPASLAHTLDELVEAEIAHAGQGRPARIVAKVNGLTDRRMARSLYRASEAGVEVDLIVRSACCVRPGVPGLSSRIRVRSILGRFLEHARIYYFEAGGAGTYYIASADWRKRNLRKRVEIAAPVADAEARARLEVILNAELNDPRAWVMRPDGSYQRLAGEGLTAQERFLRQATDPERPPVQR